MKTAKFGQEQETFNVTSKQTRHKMVQCQRNKRHLLSEQIRGAVPGANKNKMESTHTMLKCVHITIHMIKTEHLSKKYRTACWSPLEHKQVT